MKQYLDIVQNVLDNGKWKENRTGIRTLTLANQFFSHNMEDGFPILTTKKMSLQNIAVELEFFIKGRTDKAWLQKRGCHIWDNWCNLISLNHQMNYADEIDTDIDRKKAAKEIDDLGPIYGYQWRSFNKTYTQGNRYGTQDEDDGDWSSYEDQLANIVLTLKSNPNDRRMVCSAWNPNQIRYMALPPCHLLWVVTHIDGYLNLHWTQRSCDLGLGVPYNIASYALLLLLLCKEGKCRPGNLSGTLCDCHIYENHIQPLKQQITKSCFKLPQVEILSEGWTGLFNWTYDKILLSNYKWHKKLPMEIAV